jgi:hypothetical protein
MSETIAAAWADRAQRVALEVARAQWSVLNPMLAGPVNRQPVSLLDPEALLLASLGLWDEERRLMDVLAWWAVRGAALTSVRRLDTLKTAFPEAARERIGYFASWAEAGGDLRWKGQKRTDTELRTGKGPSELSLLAPSTLLLRLRAAFGVSAKPDVFAFLLTQDGAAATPKDMARAVGYAEKNVRMAARDLTLAGFVNEEEVYPVAYSSRPGFPKSFLRLLNRDGSGERVPDWIHWAAVYPFLLKVASWCDPDRPTSNYMLSSRARELYEEYRWVFRRPELKLPDPNRYPGEHYVSAFDDTLLAVSQWIGERL